MKPRKVWEWKVNWDVCEKQSALNNDGRVAGFLRTHSPRTGWVFCRSSSLKWTVINGGCHLFFVLQSSDKKWRHLHLYAACTAPYLATATQSIPIPDVTYLKAVPC